MKGLFCLEGENIMEEEIEKIIRNTFPQGNKYFAYVDYVGSDEAQGDKGSLDTVILDGTFDLEKLKNSLVKLFNEKE